MLQLYLPHIEKSAADLSIDYSEKTGKLELVVDTDVNTGNPLAHEGDDIELQLSLIRGFSESIDYQVVNNRGRLSVAVRKV